MQPIVYPPQTPGWQQIYVHSENRACVEAALDDELARLGYRAYDPFPGGMGTPPSLKDFVRMFVAPASGAWVAIVGLCPTDVRETLLAALEPCGAVLFAWLEGEGSDIAPFSRGQFDSAGLDAFLQPGATTEDLRRARLHKLNTPQQPADSALPGELDRLARSHNVNPAQAARLVDRLAGSLFGKMDRQSGGEAGAARGQAHSLLQGKAGPDWASPAGRRLDAMAALLTLPPSWREPGFDALRDAYHAARMLKRNPRASLLPDEREAIARVPNALDYTPIYFGK
jgi:hypothetical protein